MIVKTISKQQYKHFQKYKPARKAIFANAQYKANKNNCKVILKAPHPYFEKIRTFHPNILK